MKPKLLFFARDYQAQFFPFLLSEKYDSLFVTLTINEKKNVESRGQGVIACFEEMYDSLEEINLQDYHLDSSLCSDRYLNVLTVEERLEILSKEISFWRFIINKYSPIAVVNEPVAIEVSEILYLEAKRANVKYFSLMSIPLNDYFICNSEANPMYALLNEKVFKKKPSQQSINIAIDYFQKFLQGYEKPIYVQNIKSRYNVIDYLKLLKDIIISLKPYLKFYKRTKRIVIYHQNQKYYINKVIAPLNSLLFKYDNLNNYNNFDIIFFPLHVEPEASLYYWAESYSDQASIIAAIAKALSPYQILVVKEHPNQPGMLLQRKYRSLKKRISNIVYIPGEYPSSELIKKSQCVIVLTSTVGWEAILLGKPVFILGKIYYSQYSCINNFFDLNELKYIIQNKNYIYPDNEKTIRFLAQLIDYSYPGYPFPYKDLYSLESIKKIINALEAEIDNIITVNE